MSRTKEEIVSHIEQVLNDYITPVVAGHGGQINFLDYNDGTVSIELSGACSGCAGSTQTLKYGVQSMLTELVPEVENVTGVDDPFSSVAPYMMNTHWMDDDIEYLSMEQLRDTDKQ